MNNRKYSILLRKKCKCSRKIRQLNRSLTQSDKWRTLSICNDFAHYLLKVTYDVYKCSTMHLQWLCVKILENKTTFLFVFIECKQNFAHYHPCCLLSPIEDEWHFVRKWTQSHVLLIETTFCCWIRRFSKLSIFEFVHNVFTTSHFIETRELKN